MTGADRPGIRDLRIEESRLATAAELPELVDPATLSREALLACFLVIVIMLRWIFYIPLSYRALGVLGLWYGASYLFGKAARRHTDLSTVESLHFSFFAVELVLVTWLVHYLGGAEWIGALFYVLTIIYANISLSRMRGLIITLLACLLFTVLATAEYLGVVPHRSLFGVQEGLYKNAKYLAATLTGGGLGLFVVVGYTSALFASRLKERNLQLERAKAEIEGWTRTLEARVLERTEALHREIEENERLREAETESYYQTILSLARTVDAKDAYTSEHLETVTRFGHGVAELLTQEDEQEPVDREALDAALRLHDIGKVGIPDEILLKPGRLTEDEWHKMREHPVIGARILEPLSRLKKASLIVRAHHERCDGKGYPDGLKGRDIPVEARILAVVDAYHAMTSNRPYRPAMGQEKATGELKNGVGTQFDPRVVDVFLKLLTMRDGQAWD